MRVTPSYRQSLAETLKFNNLKFDKSMKFVMVELKIIMKVISKF